MKTDISGCVLAVVITIAAVSCSKVAKTEGETASDDAVTFYVDAAPQPKSWIEDTQDLVIMALPLFVFEDNTGTAFTGGAVYHKANGIWRSEKKWENREYSFFAYVESKGKGELGISNSGRTVRVTQPNHYAEPQDYADFLLSYRVSANGADRPLVRLDMERVTTAVELYMTCPANMTEVRLKKVDFINIYSGAQFNIAYHATNKDPEVDGLKNSWAVNVDETTKTTYTLDRTASPVKLNKLAPGTDRFAPQNKVMQFLTVQQSLHDVQNGILEITYDVLENGRNVEYNAAFNLSDYHIKTWKRGHKIRYYISVDTSIKLEGTIEPWKTVDFIEGTFLPK